MAKTSNNAKPAPLCTLPRRNQNGEETLWLTSQLTQALRAEYKTLSGAQKGADFLVASGMVAIPPGWTLKATAIKRFGGAFGFVAEKPGTFKPGASQVKLHIEGLPADDAVDTTND